MVAPQLTLRAYFSLARSVGLDGVEIRNDIGGNAILDGTPPSVVRSFAESAGVTILTINALQRFNEWTPGREAEARMLAAYGRECGAKALILVPTNDGSGREEGRRQSSLTAALAALTPILEDHGIVGLVEPLGFESSSLRSKREAVEAIRAVGGEQSFRLTHDTFHHHLAGEEEIFPQATGLVHISGVEDTSLSDAAMRDDHRVLVGPKDRIGNIEQLRRLFGAGYAGPVSFEPFAPALRQLADPATAIRESIGYIQVELMREAA
ncbi:MAG TPA: TIM barrel protein [Devosiaceae bacterium]|nr:TIM barrel protein [Devosiaceae bacterium]